MKRKTLRINSLLAAAVAVGLLAPVQAVAEGESITLCHATGSVTNPYRLVTTDEASILREDSDGKPGHATHTGPVFDPAINTESASGPDGKVEWGDIIPAFTGFAGLNVTEGLAWLGRSCENGGSTGTGTGTGT